MATTTQADHPDYILVPVMETGRIMVESSRTGTAGCIQSIATGRVHYRPHLSYCKNLISHKRVGGSSVGQASVRGGTKPDVAKVAGIFTRARFSASQ